MSNSKPDARKVVPRELWITDDGGAWSTQLAAECAEEGPVTRYVLPDAAPAAPLTPNQIAAGEDARRRGGDDKAVAAAQHRARPPDQSAAAALGTLRAERDQLRELLNLYNLGGWTDAHRLMVERDTLQARVAELVLAVQDAVHYRDKAAAALSAMARERDEAWASAQAYKLDLATAVLQEARLQERIDALARENQMLHDVCDWRPKK